MQEAGSLDLQYPMLVIQNASEDGLHESVNLLEPAVLVKTLKDSIMYGDEESPCKIMDILTIFNKVLLVLRLQEIGRAHV